MLGALCILLPPSRLSPIAEWSDILASLPACLCRPTCRLRDGTRGQDTLLFGVLRGWWMGRLKMWEGPENIPEMHKTKLLLKTTRNQLSEENVPETGSALTPRHPPPSEVPTAALWHWGNTNRVVSNRVVSKGPLYPSKTKIIICCVFICL